MGTTTNSIEAMEEFCKGYVQVKEQLREIVIKLGFCKEHLELKEQLKKIVRRLDDLAGDHNLIKLHIGHQKSDRVKNGGKKQ